jgi:hypothetical protein
MGIKDPSKENLKFTIGTQNYKNYTTIGGRSALDLRAEVGVWCMVVHGGAWWCIVVHGGA